MTDNMYFYGGLDTVGGVQMLFTSGDTGILCDAGIQHHGLFTAPFIHLNEPIQPINGREIIQYLLSKMAPPLLDIYDQKLVHSIRKSDLLNIWGVSEFPTCKEIYIFITHIHQDHIALLPYLAEHMTVFMHQDAYAQYKALISSRYYLGTKAKIKTFTDEDVIDLENMRITTLEVDHMTSGTTGFLLETKENKIAYTADWRMNGLYKERMHKFIERCQREAIDILITETTMVKKGITEDLTTAKSEKTLLSEYEQLIASSPSLVYLLALPMNIERIANLIQVTKQAGKIFLMEEKIAAFWFDAIQHGIHELKGHPAITDQETIKILDSNQHTHLPYDRLKIEDVIREKEKYVFHLNYASLAYLIELEQLRDHSGASILINANTPAHQDTLQKWIDAFDIAYHNISNSGHATHQEISNLIEQINPRVVIPVHGKRPDLLDSKGIYTFFPTRGEETNIEHVLQNLYKVKGV